jgi:hypothetical protein
MVGRLTDVVAHPIVTASAIALQFCYSAVIESNNSPIDETLMTLITIQCCGDMCGAFAGGYHTIMAALTGT